MDNSERAAQETVMRPERARDGIKKVRSSAKSRKEGLSIRRLVNPENFEIVARPENHDREQPR